MIKNKDIYQWVQRMVRKEVRGNVLSPADFNVYLSMNQRLRLDYLKKQMELTDSVTSSLSIYQRTSVLTLANNTKYGSVAIPTGYEKHLKAMAQYNGDFSRKVDVVTNLELQERFGCSLTKPTDRNPIMVYENGIIKVYPYLANIELTYLSTPQTAFLDYVMNNVTRTVRYLDEGESVVLGINEVRPDGLFLQPSRTVEMKWDEDDSIAVAHMILRAIGIPVRDEGAFRIGSEETMKSERL